MRKIIDEATTNGVMVQSFSRDEAGQFTMEWRHTPVVIRDGYGEGEPVITADLIAFNGDGTAKDEYGDRLDHESFWIERIFRPESWDKPEEGRYFSCVKTARKPYDAVTTACLMAFERHFPEGVRLSSDGDYADWEGGRELMERALGYRGVGILSGRHEGEDAAD